MSNIPAKVRMIPAAGYVKGDKGDLRAETTMQMGTPYAMSRDFLRAPSGLPCIKPPFGSWWPWTWTPARSPGVAPAGQP